MIKLYKLGGRIMIMAFASVAAWEKVLCLLGGFTMYALVKVADYYIEKDKEAEAQQ